MGIMSFLSGELPHLHREIHGLFKVLKSVDTRQMVSIGDVPAASEQADELVELF